MGFYQRQVQPRLLDRALRSSDATVIRARVCAAVAGEVVELGYGSGLNQPHYPATVTGVTALEPSQVALALAAKRQASSRIPVVVGGDDAQRMPFPDNSFDAALSTWTLCGIPDPVAALREVRRVLKPGGLFHFVEHGLAPDADVQVWQQRVNGLHRRVAGCDVDRDVRSAVEASGLRIETWRSYYADHGGKVSGSFHEGTAVA